MLSNNPVRNIVTRYVNLQTKIVRSVLPNEHNEISYSQNTEILFFSCTFYKDTLGLNIQMSSVF